MMDASARRHELVASLFPQGIPSLWCPPLTHFREDGQFDTHRIRSHLTAISPYARGLLVPGSTGEGWDMTDVEVRRLLAFVLDTARELELSVQIGVLRKNLSEMLTVIKGTVEWLRERTGAESARAALSVSGVVGFTVCAPSGAERSQQDICESLAAVLELGHPTAIYQLPQVTHNEVSAESVARLAARYAHFYLLKDTSGTDGVALAGVDLQGVFLVRGAEGQYARWLKAGGGPYDGILLSSANCLAPELATMINALEVGDDAEAARLSERIQGAVQACFSIVENHPVANPFTNANKILDHIMAYGHDALHQPPPFVRGGHQLPRRFVEQAYEMASQYDLVPGCGYLQ
ncbi:MAG: dihydrodipicolinate synthase family protein [Pirellulaceae bacterium]